MSRIVLLVVAAVAVATPTLALAQVQPYVAPKVHHLVDPFGRDAPPPGGPAPDIRPDPIPAYRQLPPRMRMMQQPLCQPAFDPQTGNLKGYMCSMANGRVEFIGE